MDKHMLYLAGLLNEGEFDRTSDLQNHGVSSDAMLQSYAFKFGFLESLVKRIKFILEPAMRNLESPEWNPEEDGAMMLEHLKKAVREALKHIESSKKDLYFEK